MGITGQSITLANSIIGVGILAMPFCFQQCGVILATFILIFMGLVSRLCCHFLLKSAIIVRRRNLEFLAYHVFGPVGKMLVELGIIGFLMGTCIAYFVVVGDLGPEIISRMFNINQSDMLRTWTMVVVSAACVLPLGLLRQVDSLSSVSAATIGFYFCLVIKVILEAVQRLVEGGGGGGGNGRLSLWRWEGALQCLPIFSMALFCQTQLFGVLESCPSLPLERMNSITRAAVNMCTAVYWTLGLFGYIAYSSHNISGNVLMNLSPTLASDVIKFGFVLSLACSFPLVIFPCRASLYSFLYRKEVGVGMSPARHRWLTTWIVCAGAAAAWAAPGVQRVLGVLGATCGAAVCLVFPAAAHLALPHTHTHAHRRGDTERLLAKGTILLGLVILVLGTYSNLQADPTAATAGPGGPGGERLTPEKLDQIVNEYFKNKRLKEEQDDNIKPSPKKKLKIQNVVNHKNRDESVMQPPNPVESVIRVDNNVVQLNRYEEKKIEVVDKAIIPDVSNLESHPRNLKSKLNNEGKLFIDEPKSKQEEKEKVNEKAQDNLDIMKQQLIETIKQHGEEQKELIKEQKEILHDIKKTNEELQRNKKEMDSQEAKKIAVENIQKIAKIAIQSLGGASDRPVAKAIEEKDIESLNEIANEAVQEIAKKAVESIAAIQDRVKEPDRNDDTAKDNLELDNNNVPNKMNNINQNPAANIVAENQDVDQKIDSLLQNNNVPNEAHHINGQNIHNGIVNGAPNADKRDTIPAQFNGVKSIPVLPALKMHSHSLDEPQSYKEGENLNMQKKLDQNIPNDVIHNVPLAVAMNANSMVKNAAIVKESLKDNVVQPKPLVRSKREINLDNARKNEDKCDNTVTNKITDKILVTEPRDVLKNVDLNEALDQRLSIVETVIGRSLKGMKHEDTKR